MKYIKLLFFLTMSWNMFAQVATYSGGSGGVNSSINTPTANALAQKADVSTTNTSLASKLQTVLTELDLKNYTSSLYCFYNNTVWERKLGNYATSGDSIINVSPIIYWNRVGINKQDMVKNTPAIVLPTVSPNFTGNVSINSIKTFVPLHVGGNEQLVWNPEITANTIIGTGNTTGGSLFVNTASLTDTYHSGLGVNGTFAGSTSTVNIKALGVNSLGGYNSNLAFWTTSNISVTERMRILDNGNIGIGTPMALGTLQIGGYNNGLANDLVLFAPLSNISTGNSIKFDMNVSGGVTRSRLAEIQSLSYQNLGVNQLRFNLGTWNNNVVTTNVLTLQDDGKVGVGTTNPTSKLQVVGLVAYADNLTATLAGLTVGAFYRTSTGILMVVF